IGTRGSPGCGSTSKDPKRLATTLAGIEFGVANDGRSLKMESAFKSCPVVTLYGVPELAIMNGPKRKAYGSPIVPPKNTRCRISKADRPGARLILLLIDGKLPVA